MEYGLNSWDFCIPGYHGPQIRQSLSFIFSWEESLHVLIFKSCPCSKPIVPSSFYFLQLWRGEYECWNGLLIWNEIIVSHFWFAADICFLLLAQSQTPFSDISGKAFFFFSVGVTVPLPLLRGWLGVTLSWPLCSCLPVTLEKELANNRQR